MQVNSVNYLGSTSFGKKENKCKKDCPSCNPNVDNSMVHVPRPLYNKLLGMAMLAMVAGGPVAMTSCNPMNPPEDLTENVFYPKDTTKNPDTSIGGIDTTVVTPTTKSVSDKLTDMVDFLRLDFKTASTIGASEVVKNGDVIEFGHHDDVLNADFKLAINQEKSTKDTLVFDGTNISQSGQVGYIRHTVYSTVDGAVVKKQTTKYGKPISENSGWNVNGTYKYVSSVDGIKESKILSDGSELYQCKYVPKNGTTVSKVIEDGSIYDLTNVSVTKLKNIDTGLHDVHM